MTNDVPGMSDIVVHHRNTKLRRWWFRTLIILFAPVWLLIAAVFSMFALIYNPFALSVLGHVWENYWNYNGKYY